LSQQLNLYNPLFERKEKPFSVRAMAQCLAFIAVALLVFYVYAVLQMRSTERLAGQLREQLESQRAQVGKLAGVARQPRSKTLESEVARLEAELQARRSTLNALGTGELGNTAGFSEFFAAFGRQALPGVWLTAITIATSGSALTIQGRALRAESVPALLRALRDEPVMRGRSVTELKLTAKTAPAAEKATQGQPGPQAYVEFSFSAPVQPAEAVPGGTP
jgi:Tfp pilus assembly protein PilN